MQNFQQPLFDSAEHGDLEILKQFIESGSNINAVNDHDINLLHLAAQGGHSNVIEFLIKKGIDVNALTKDGWSALHFTCRKGYEKATEILLKHGINPDFVGLRYHRSALHYASEQGHSKVVALLLKAGAKTSGVDTNGDTPLALAIRREHEKTIELLRKAVIL